jgi:hypothetical protein
MRAGRCREAAWGYCRKWTKATGLGRRGLADSRGLEPALSANSTQSDQSAASLRMLSRAARRAVEHSAVGYDLGDTKPEQVRLGPGKQ